MPEICRFYGLVIKMYFSDHNPPHFHVLYNEFNAIFDIENLEIIEGDLPPRAVTLVKEWGNLYKNELLKIWNNQEFIKLPGLK